MKVNMSERTPTQLLYVQHSSLTPSPHRTGHLGRLSSLRPGPRHLSHHPGVAVLLGRQGWGLRGRRRGRRWEADPRFLVGVRDLVVVCRDASRDEDGLADRGGGAVALSGGGGEEGPRRGVVGRRTGGGGAASG